MAFVRVDIAARTQDQKEAIISGITDVMVANGARLENVQVLLVEHSPKSWGTHGTTFHKFLNMPDD
ncbi:MAG: tautomerase family protein [Nostocoides sp.]